MKLPRSPIPFRLAKESKYRPRRYQQRDASSRKKPSIDKKVLMIIDGDWKEYKRYQPNWDARLHEYMYRYYTNKGNLPDESTQE